MNVHGWVFFVASVAGLAPRLEIRTELRRMGFREGIDFVCAA